jgi:hypothetical protein
VSPETLNRLKRDLDRATDAFDRLRIFQFPVEGTLALTTLRDKKWRRMVARGADTVSSGVVPPRQARAEQPGRRNVSPVSRTAVRRRG